MPLRTLKQSLKRAIDTVPKALGLHKIPALLPESTAANELKLSLRSYCQTDTYSCGAIAGWSVLEFLKPGADFLQFYADCAPSKETGTSTSRLTKALRKHGISVSHRNDLDFDQIKSLLRAGKPILVCTGEGALFDDDAAHWVVIYGCGWNPNRIFLSGKTRPGFSRETLSYRDFKSIWSPVNEGLVCSVKRTLKKK